MLRVRYNDWCLLFSIKDCQYHPILEVLFHINCITWSTIHMLFFTFANLTESGFGHCTMLKSKSVDPDIYLQLIDCLTSLWIKSFHSRPEQVLNIRWSHWLDWIWLHQSVVRHWCHVSAPLTLMVYFWQYMSYIILKVNPKWFLLLDGAKYQIWDHYLAGIHWFAVSATLTFVV
jgi:hypothetical protein